MEVNKNQQISSETANFSNLDLQSLLENSREAISRAALEVLREKDDANLIATTHSNHSSYSSSSGPWG